MARIQPSTEQLGQLANQQHELYRRVSAGILPQSVTRQGLQRLIEGRFDSYPITVDYSQTLSAMIAIGQYDYFAEEITATNFRRVVDEQGRLTNTSVAGDVEQSVTSELFSIARPATILEEIVPAMSLQGLRPATLEELLSFGATYPQLQRRFAILALGSVWIKGQARFFPCLVGSEGKRGLDYELRDRNPISWNSGTRFLVIQL